MTPILFDLDGTLLDTAPTFSHIINTQLSSPVHPDIKQDEMRYRVSKGGRYMVYSAFEHAHNESELNALLNEFLMVYEKNLHHLTVPLPGITEMIEQLNTLHIPWGIITNKKTAFTLPLLAKYKLFDAAKTVICGDTTSERKPNPKPLIAACEELGVKPESCIYVGDAITDIEAGRHAGMQTIIANFGYIPPETRLRDWQADYIAHEPTDIIKIATQ